MTQRVPSVATVFGCLVFSAVYAQDPPQSRPAFEVASVRLSDPKDPAAAVEFWPGGRFTANIALKYIVERAFGIDDYQLSGDPDWLKSERYTIQAKAAGPATEDQLRMMTQTLLADRFRLRVHHETRQIPVYALIVGKDRPKLQQAKDNTLCGGQGCFGISRGKLTSSGGTLARMATVLTRILDRPVLDKTQLTGNYDFMLHFDQRSVVTPNMGLGGDTAPEQEPSIFTAVQEQIGLKLEPRKEPVDVLVIDHVERPSEN